MAGSSLEKTTATTAVVAAYDRNISRTVVDSINHLYFGGFYLNPLEDMSLSVDAIQAIAGVPQQNSLGASLGKYAGGVLHTNGKVYAVPFNATQVLEFDPTTRVAALFGTLSGTAKFMGAAVGSNAKFYLAPYDSTVAVEIDPVTKTITSFGNFAGVNKWSGSVAGLNGSIYCIPYNETRVLRIVPSTRATSFITIPSIPGVDKKWRGGVNSPKTAEIIGVPHGTNRLLRISPTAGTAVLGIELAPLGTTFSGGVCGPDGKIYFVPANATAVHWYDPVAVTVGSFGKLPAGEDKWMGGTLAPNGKIYCMPHNYDSILEIDIANQAVRRMGQFEGNAKWAGGVLTTLGNVVGIPFNEESLVSVLGTGMAGTNWWALSAHANSF